jgi:tetratricopeptide (TPR) repeat protein
MNENPKQSRIVFLSVPESLRVQLENGHEHDDEDEHEHEHFTIDPAIPIPVEIPPGETNLDMEQLSWEMIISGMLRIISAGEKDPSFDIDKDDINYYRRFVLEVRPNILGEFTEAAILKARNGDYDMALEILDVLEGLFPRFAPVLLNRALVLERRADAWAGALEKTGREEEAETEYDRAHGAYKEILALKPPFPDGLFNAGFFFMKRRNF